MGKKTVTSAVDRNVNVRNEPNMGSPAIRLLMNMEQEEFDKEKNGFLHLVKGGWVRKDLVTISPL
jgi:hypothetical protein